jgi:adenine-specific DNA methylase
LLNYIEEAVKSLPIKKDAVFFDLFSGTTAVGQHFKKLGYTVYSNDFLEFAYSLAHTYIQTNTVPKFTELQKKIKKIKNASDVIEYLKGLPVEAGFITKNYSPYKNNFRQFLSVSNAQKVDTIRKTIYLWKKKQWINETEYYYLLTALIEGINLVSNVTGTYAAFLKTWDKRALNGFSFSMPKIIQSKNKNLAMRGDANKLVSKYEVDVLYLDPPYNSRQFASNYFFLELIAEGWFEKEPEIYGRAGMRNYDHQKSDFSIKKKAAAALQDLVKKAKAKYIILSYSDEGIIDLDEIRNILKGRGTVTEFMQEHKRYRAINQDGSHVTTHELLFIVKVNK